MEWTASQAVSGFVVILDHKFPRKILNSKEQPQRGRGAAPEREKPFHHHPNRIQTTRRTSQRRSNRPIARLGSACKLAALCRSEVRRQMNTRARMRRMRCMLAAA
jgi:hypothetical protein